MNNFITAILVSMVLCKASGQQLIHPDTLICAKWKSDNVESVGSDLAVSPDYEYGGLSQTEAIQTLAKNGVNAVVLRYNSPDRIDPDIPNNWKQKDFDAATINLIKAIKTYSPGTAVYLWKRQWFNKDNTQAAIFIDFAVQYINLAKAAGCDDIIAGICPIETNLDYSSETLERALYTIKQINAQTNGWMRTKSFFWPGAGMGQWFVDIDKGGEQFFRAMQGECAMFSFIFKYMQSQPNNAVLHLNDAFSIVTKSGRKEEIKAFLKDQLGLGDLSNYLKTYKSAYPNYANVIFWGDNGDGLNSFMSNKPTVIDATRELLVEENGWGGAVFNLVIANSNADYKRVEKSVLINTNGIVSPNGSTYKTWNEWPKNRGIAMAINTAVNTKSKIYPNPANDYFKIQGFENAKITLLTVDGRMIKQLTHETNTWIGNLNQGLYLVLIQQGDREFTEKLMIVR